MIAVTQTRSDRFGVLSKEDLSYTPQRCVESLLRYELSYGGRITECAEGRVVAETPVFGKIDRTEFVGGTEEMKALVRAAQISLAMNGDEEHCELLNDLTIKALIAEGETQAPSIVAWAGPMIRGMLSTRQLAMHLIDRNNEEWAAWLSDLIQNREWSDGKAWNAETKTVKFEDLFYVFIKVALIGPEWVEWARDQVDELGSAEFIELANFVLTGDEAASTPEKATALADGLFK